MAFIDAFNRRRERLDPATLAERIRRIDGRAFTYDTTPFLRYPTACLGDIGGTCRVIIQSPAQVGKTVTIENFLAWVCEYDRQNALLILDSDKTGKRMSKNRLRPFLRDTCGINTKESRALNPDASKEISNIGLAPGANLIIGSSKSASDLCSTPVKYLLCDELDRWKDKLKDSGILSLAYFTLLNTARLCRAICKERDVLIRTSLSLQIRSLARSCVLDLRSARIRHAALPRLYGFIGCSIFDLGFSLVSTFCNRLICSIDLIFNFRDKLTVNPRFGKFHCIQVRHNAIIDEGE